MDAQFWDDRYRSRDWVFSGAANGVLVTEVTDLPPGQALDLGCGEGADALWLADSAGRSPRSISPRPHCNVPPGRTPKAAWYGHAPT